MTRPDQDNFTIHVGRAGVRPFVAALEQRFGVKAEVQDLNFPDSDPSQMFALHGTDATVVVNPVPDQRCNPNAPMHATYKSGEYRIDLVFETASPMKRLSAKQLLVGSAKEIGQPLIPFKEC